MNWIRPRLIGRLGNNFFQIAAAIAYAKKYHCRWGIKKGYMDKGFHANQVDRFLPHLPACNEFCKPYTEFQPEWAGREFNYHRLPQFNRNIELVGFWQSWKYFEGAEEEIRKWLAVPVVDGYRDYVSIHVRRGDYAQLADNFPPVDTEYIDRALDEIFCETNCRKAIVFSDDMNWCKNNIPKIAERFQIEYSEGRNEWEDLSIMASCGHNIIANSSFSWWGAWLNTNPNKRVVSPSHKWGNWFGRNNGVKHDCVDLIPPGWIEIEWRTIKK